MPRANLALAVIGDEIGPSLDEMIEFARSEKVSRLDMRTVAGRNLLGMEPAEIDAIAGRLRAAGIAVPTFVSPLLKWTAPGRGTSAGKVDFAFDPAQCPAPDPFAYAVEVAERLGARRLRIFSYLRYPEYRPDDLAEPIGRLTALAERHDLTLELENEPVCNVGTIAELRAFFDRFDHPRLRPLVDICNAWSMGERPTADDLARLAPRTDQIHLKDRDVAARRTVALGEGDMPWATDLAHLLDRVSAPEVLASIETHVPAEPRAATTRSVAALRRLAREIGVTLS